MSPRWLAGDRVARCPMEHQVVRFRVWGAVEDEASRMLLKPVEVAALVVQELDNHGADLGFIVYWDAGRQRRVDCAQDAFNLQRTRETAMTNPKEYDLLPGCRSRESAAGRVAVHNSGKTARVHDLWPLGADGFRAWTVPTGSPGIMSCGCGWAPQLGEHFHNGKASGAQLARCRAMVRHQRHMSSTYSTMRFTCGRTTHLCGIYLTSALRKRCGSSICLEVGRRQETRRIFRHRPTVLRGTS